MRGRACFCGLFSALATIGGSGVGGMTAGETIADVVVVLGIHLVVSNGSNMIVAVSCV